MKNKDLEAYYHVCTDGNAVEWLFKDIEDFIEGINRIAICSYSTGVFIVAYILMDNHLHFVLHGSMPNCKRFITSYKMLTGRWISNKYHIDGHLKHLPTQLILIEDEEQLLETIAYIDRNSIVAGYRFLPCEYPWGSARFMFHNSSCSNVHLRTLGEFNKDEIHAILKTWKNLPSDWKMDKQGMLDPKCFIRIDLAEKLFRTPARYLYYLSKKLEGQVEMKQGTKAFIPDKELRTITEKLGVQLFGKNSIKELDFNSKIVIARKLRYNYASTPKQIARMLSLEYEIISKFI